VTKIMIIDDSSLSRRLLRRILEPAGYQVVEVASAEEALAFFSTEKPDLVLLDLVMPGTHGLDLLAQLRAQRPELRVVIATADIQTSTQVMAENAGACGYVHKPFVPALIVEAVRTALRQAV
jgi:two-component system chemotaxis response regulator CheY